MPTRSKAASKTAPPDGCTSEPAGTNHSPVTGPNTTSSTALSTPPTPTGTPTPATTRSIISTQLVKTRSFASLPRSVLSGPVLSWVVYYEVNSRPLDWIPQALWVPLWRSSVWLASPGMNVVIGIQTVLERIVLFSAIVGFAAGVGLVFFGLGSHLSAISAAGVVLGMLAIAVLFLLSFVPRRRHR